MPKIPFWIFIVIAVLYFTALRVDMMEVDATQYAEISWEMTKTGNYLEVYQYNEDYLDKPPFLFWISALSISVFGPTNLGYKLPSILFALWALYATYRLARLLYNEDIARWSALVLAVCQGMFLMTNDIRTDTILMSWVITAIWAIKECEIKRRWQFVLLGTLSIACGMMTKGPIALMVPVFAFGSDWLLKRKWKNIFSAHHLVDLVLIAVMLIPMSIGLYRQFDLHPEKTVNGLQGVSGLRFFYWSQSFGRITGESPWDNGAGLDFLFTNMLWSFLPWMFFLIPALIINMRTLIIQRFRLKEGQEFLTTGGFILAYLALGSSNYQLPHYIFVVFPLAAIMVAKLLHDMIALGQYKKLLKIIYPVQVFILAGLLTGAMLLLTIVFPGNYSGIVFCTAGIVLWLYILLSKKVKTRLLWLSICGMLVVNAILSSHFYPELLKYQYSSQMGRYLKENKLPADSIGGYQIERFHALHFYADNIIKIENDLQALEGRPYIITNDQGRKEIDAHGWPYRPVLERKMFDVTFLTLPFLNPQTRHTILKNYYLLKIQTK
jgi:4-amino-4-deoxy-L-arabinose transferase-like glycosyltransferase